MSFLSISTHDILRLLSLLYVSSGIPPSIVSFGVDILSASIRCNLKTCGIQVHSSTCLNIQNASPFSSHPSCAICCISYKLLRRMESHITESAHSFRISPQLEFPLCILLPFICSLFIDTYDCSVNP